MGEELGEERGGAGVVVVGGGPGANEVGEVLGDERGGAGAGVGCDEVACAMRCIRAKISVKFGPLPCRACVSLLRMRLESMSRCWAGSGPR